MFQLDKPDSRIGLALAWLLSAILTITGLYFLIGGVWLLSLRGSPYFALESLFLLSSAYFLARRQMLAFPLFIAFYVTTALWSFWDAGWDFWPLLSRLMVPSVFLLIFRVRLP